MYGLPKTTDLSALIGREVIQVCIGLHEAIIIFDKDISITVEGEFALASNHGLQFVNKADLVKILGTTVTAVLVREQGELALNFKDGSTLALYDSNSGFESYQISLPGNTIVV